MKATLFIIENDKDHAQAKGLIEELMGSGRGLWDSIVADSAAVPLTAPQRAEL